MATKKSTSSKKKTSSKPTSKPRVKAKVEKKSEAKPSAKKTEAAKKSEAKSTSTTKSKANNIKTAPVKGITDQNLFIYQILGTVVGIILTFTFVLSIFNAYRLAETKKEVEGDVDDKLESLNDRMYLTYDFLERHTGMTPADMKLDISKPSTDERWLGKKDARFVWVVYGDLNCGYCAKMHDTLLELQEKNQNDLAIVYRHLPFQTGAQALAETAECVAKADGEDAFWKYVVDAYDGKATSSLDSLPEYVSAEKVKSCMESGEAYQKVQDDLKEAQDEFFNSTPTSVLWDLKDDDTKVITGSIKLDRAQEILEDFEERGKGW